MPRIGLRGRIVAALVLTSAVTLGVAAITLFSPLEHRLNGDELEQLRSVADTSRPAFARVPSAELHPGSHRLRALARAMSRRSDAHVLLVLPTGRVLASPDLDRGDRVPDAVVVARDNRTIERTVTVEGVRQAEVVTPVRTGDRRIVLVLRRSYSETATVVAGVKRVFFVAAAFGLATALLLGFALASGLVRRVRRLRDSAERVADVGPEAEVLEDPARDEIGDLSRSFATMQANLRRQEQARRTFVATASHELRTPLTALELMLDGLTEELDRPRPDTADAREQAALAHKQARRLARLAGDLLELSRVDAGLPLREDLAEVGELCGTVVNEFEQRAAAREVAVEVVADEPAWAVVDPGGLARIVRILLDNALRFSPPSERVVVTVANAPTGPTVTVADRGPGIPAAERERIFERFARGAQTAEDGGFGLGLAIGREVAAGMGGELTLLDTPHGATFALRLRPAPAGSLAVLSSR